MGVVFLHVAYTSLAWEVHVSYHKGVRERDSPYLVTVVAELLNQFGVHATYDIENHPMA